MGVTLKSKNYSLDFGYGGFYNVRRKVAELLGEDTGEFYKMLLTSNFVTREESKKLNKKMEDILKKYNCKMDGVLSFLMLSDCGGISSPGDCKQIYEVIKDYDDDICYGYSDRPDCAMFKDFKEIVKDCIDGNCSMEWS